MVSKYSPERLNRRTFLYGLGALTGAVVGCAGPNPSENIRLVIPDIYCGATASKEFRADVVGESGTMYIIEFLIRDERGNNVYQTLAIGNGGRKTFKHTVNGDRLGAGEYTVSLTLIKDNSKVSESKKAFEVREC